MTIKGMGFIHIKVCPHNPLVQKAFSGLVHSKLITQRHAAGARPHRAIPTLLNTNIFV